MCADCFDGSWATNGAANCAVNTACGTGHTCGAAAATQTTDAICGNCAADNFAANGQADCAAVTACAGTTGPTDTVVNRATVTAATPLADTICTVCADGYFALGNGACGLCSPVTNGLAPAAVKCTTATNSKLTGNCIAAEGTVSYWKNTATTEDHPADTCEVMLTCGNQVAASAIRTTSTATDGSSTTDKQCDPCAADTWALLGTDNCVANTVCVGKQVGGVARLTGATRTAAGVCDACTAGSFAADDATDCAACGNQATGCSRLTGDTCASCATGTWGANDAANCLVVSACGAGHTVGHTDATLIADVVCGDCAAGNFAVLAADACAPHTVCGT
jgi:hypothetical protein